MRPQSQNEFKIQDSRFKIAVENVVASKNGGLMTRRQLVLGIVFSLSAALAVAVPKKSGPLEVTYYYLPG